MGTRWRHRLGDWVARIRVLGSIPTENDPTILHVDLVKLEISVDYIFSLTMVNVVYNLKTKQKKLSDEHRSFCRGFVLVGHYTGSLFFGCVVHNSALGPHHVYSHPVGTTIATFDVIQPPKNQVDSMP